MHTTSCSLIKSFSFAMEARKLSDDWCGCPGIGMSICTSFTSASGSTASTASRAASALGLPSAASRWVKRLCRTGFEKETLPESTNVIFLQPQPINCRAMPHPKVPEPKSRNLRFWMRAGSSSGITRHFMSFTLRSTALAAIVFESRKRVRSVVAILDHPARKNFSGIGSNKAASAPPLSSSKEKTRDRNWAVEESFAAYPPLTASLSCGSRKAMNFCLPGR
mmetsp:Transcript_47757/g.86017  ORF Transcript_47757/g.86017 Transcript_47757/m.86017 type:complete len:222 (-) Transcript_47757:416-1081(-)